MSAIGALVAGQTSSTNHSVVTSKPRGKDAVLTEEHLRESARLKKLYLNAHHGLSQAAFGAKYDIGNQGAVWQCLNGQGMPISLKAARGFARGLGVDLVDFSPRLAAEAAKNAEFAPVEGETDFVDVKHLSVPLAAGHGAIGEVEEAPGHVKFTSSFLRSIGVSASSARLVDVRGPSMDPTIRDGSILLVSTNNREPVSNGIFALARAQEGLIVKRLVQLGDDWVARSDNRDFPDINIGDAEPITILGRALWMGVKL